MMLNVNGVGQQQTCRRFARERRQELDAYDKKDNGCVPQMTYSQRFTALNRE